MKYYWSKSLKDNSFEYWEVETEVELLKELKKFYKTENYDYGETVYKTYQRIKQK